MKSKGKKRKKLEPLAPLTGDQLVDAVAKYLKARDKGTKAYQQAGEIAERLMVSLAPGEELRFSRKRGNKIETVRFVMLDPFVNEAGQPGRVWKHTPVDRFAFEMDVIDQADASPAPTDA